MRDRNILLSYKREINLNSKVTKKKNKYTRKIKHKGKNYEKIFY